MSDTAKVIMSSIQKGQTSYSTQKVQPKTTWNNYVKQNYKHASKSTGHPMTTLSREYKNLNK